MRPLVSTVGPLVAASATNIRTASAGTAGALVLNGTTVSGGVATLDTPRRVLITNAADETGKTIVLTGTGRTGQTQSETITLGGAGSTASVLDYKTVTSAVLDVTSAGNLSIGTNGVAGGRWLYLDPWALSNIALQINVTGTVNYTVQTSLDDPNRPATTPVTPDGVVWVNSNDTAVVGATGTQQSNLFFVPAYVRVVLNSGTGSVTMTAIQSGAVPQ